MTIRETGDELRETGKELLAYSQDEFGERLRAVTRYSRSEHDPIYTREDIPNQLQLDEGTRPMLRHPLVRMHRAARDLSKTHPTLDEPDVAVYVYGDVAVVQFPITDDDGLIVTLDWEGDLPGDYLSDCRSIVYGPK